MLQAPALLSLAVTMGLVLARPRIGAIFRVGPAFAATIGVLVMLVSGLVDRADLIAVSALMWRPLVAVSSIMVTTAIAERVGLMHWLASLVEARAGASVTRLFTLVYLLSASTAAILNNDSAILLLTPLVVTIARRRYPDRPRLVIAFSFVVFMAAGVAPFVVSNPMNMIVAAYAGIDFNAYAIRMVPIAIAGWIVGFVVLRFLFRGELHEAPVAPTGAAAPTRTQVHALLLVLAVLVAYPIVAHAGGPVWMVALGGAALAIVLAVGHRAANPREVLANGVSWNILGFLVAVSVLGVGLRNAGLVQRLTSIYGGGGGVTVGVVSALGSAIVNNHPMSIINMMALDAVPGSGVRNTLAALIGGDIGPRLLPMGSLAGLLWLEALRKLKVDISPTRFAIVGAAVTVPTLIVSLALLYAMT